MLKLPYTNNALNEQRIPILDTMRGFALCGIIFANLMSFTGFYTLSLSQIQLLPLVDRATLFFIDWFIEGKFYTVFAILLGIGFALQQDKLNRKKLSINRFWLQRMLVLTVIGLCHMFLVWHGDILTLYSLLGICLLYFTRFSQQKLLIIIILLLSTPLAIHILLTTTELSFWSMLTPILNNLKIQLGYQDITLLTLRTSANAIDVFFGNIFSAIPRPMAYLKTGRPFQLLGQFLLGVYLVRSYLLTQVSEEQANKLPSGSTLIWLFIFGLILNFLYALIKAKTGSPFTTDNLGLIQGLVYHLGSIILALSYMLILLKLANNNRCAWLHKLSVLGKMSLTQYLVQTTLCVFLFYGYGLSLMGQVPFFSILLFGIAILLTQYFVGKYWLSYFSQGPMEWLWRRLSYTN